MSRKNIFKILFLTAVFALSLFCFSCEKKGGQAVNASPETEDKTPVESMAESSDIADETVMPNEETSAETNGESEENEKPEPEEALGYVAPDGWYAPVFETKKVTGGDYVLEHEVMGLKVYYVQKALGIYERVWGYYRQRTMDEVIRFQMENGIENLGVVDLQTWTELGYSEKEWNELGTYVTPVKIKKSSTVKEMRKIIVDTAKEYIGTPYVVGASGKPGEGVDCSGLALQCMYAVGVYPDGLDPVQHSTVEEYNSRLMWADPKLKPVYRGDMQPGDLVFYGRPGSRVVCHVAIYAGDDECIEALSGEVEILPVDKDEEGYIIIGYKSIFAE